MNIKLNGQTVLVTGADGFIGSHLTELLLQAGAKVRALAHYNSFNSWGWLEDLACLGDGIEIVSGDVRDADYCRQLCREVDIVFHLAALVAVPYSFVAPGSYVSTNVSGTLNMCQAALSAGCSRFIQMSTSEVYGTAQYVPIDENHPLQPQSPYSASKIGGDSIAYSFHHTYGLPVTIARPFNTYGPRQSARAVIPTIITQIASGQNNVKLGDLDPTRDFTYVEDTCRALISIAMASESIGEIINIGSNKEITVRDLLNLVGDIMESKPIHKLDNHRVRPWKSEVFRLLCDNQKLIKLTDFKHQFDLRSGLERTVSWFQSDSNLSRYKPDIFNL